MNSQIDKKLHNNNLHNGWRTFFVVSGIMLCLISLFLFWHSPLRIEWQGVGTSDKTTIQSQSDSTTYSIALLAGGILMLLLAANGRKMLEVSSKGAKFDSEREPSENQIASDAESPEEIQSQSTGDELVVDATPKSTFKKDGFQYQVFSADSIPLKVLGEISNSPSCDIQNTGDIAYAFRRSGKGNHAWFIKNQNGKTYQISYGGRGKVGSTVSESKNNDEN